MLTKYSFFGIVSRLPVMVLSQQAPIPTIKGVHLESGGRFVVVDYFKEERCVWFNPAVASLRSFDTYPDSTKNQGPTHMLKTESTTVEGKKCILIIDDDTLILRSLSRSLTRRGYSVDTASNGSDALDLMDKNTYHGVICDGNMPKLFGYEVYDLALKKFGESRMPGWVFQSGGACDFGKLRERAPLLEKPVSVTALLDALEGVLK